MSTEINKRTRQTLCDECGKGEREIRGLTVVLSVIFKTSFASADFHFTQYRVCNIHISTSKRTIKKEIKAD